MFTGLIQRVGRLEKREPVPGGLRLVVSAGAWNPPLAAGESMAVNGVCLTLAHAGGKVFACDLLRETRERSNLDAKQPGCALNLERALKMGDPLGGHLVTGHVDGTGKLVEKRTIGRDRILRFACAGALLDDMVEKGSVAVDGVSLTVAALGADGFSVHIVPYTWSHTGLGALRVGDSVNLETDIIGKHVRRRLASGAGAQPLTMERLRQAGFGEWNDVRDSGQSV